MAVRHRLHASILCCAVAASACARAAHGQEAKGGAKKDAPKVISVVPLGILRGGKSTIRVRGTGLDAATEVRFPDAREGRPAPQATIKSKGKAKAVAGADPKSVGDTEAEVELTVPPDEAADRLTFVVVTPAGQTEPRPVPVIDRGRVVEEKEPNGSFREAQPLEPGKVVLGAVAADGDVDVDVFRVAGKKGQTLVAEVLAARFGSPLDPLLTLYDAAGHVLAANDDAGEGAGGGAGAGQDVKDVKDARVALTLPANGTYYLSLTDANDKGTPGHTYQLSVRCSEAAR